MNTNFKPNNYLDSVGQNEKTSFQSFTFSWLIFNMLKICGIDFSKTSVNTADKNTKSSDAVCASKETTDFEVSKTETTIEAVKFVKKRKTKKHPKDYYYPPFGKDKIAVIDNFIRSNKILMYILTAIFFRIMVLPHTPFIKTATIMIAFIVIGSMSRIWLKYIPLHSFGFELILLFTIVSGKLFGPGAGLIVGVISMVLSAAITDEEPMKLWPAFVAIAIVGNLSGVLTIASISVLGVTLTVLYDVIISVIYYFLGSSGAKIILFDITHITWNYYMFYNIAPWLVLLVV
ncbi:MAG: hypothetical protein K0B07_02670 [DPANN group archaeon]|nr:hypothetical protein [DPANN group archaeon]